MSKLDDLLIVGVQVEIEDLGAGRGTVVVHTEEELLAAIRVGMQYSTSSRVTIRPVMLVEAKKGVSYDTE